MPPVEDNVPSDLSAVPAVPVTDATSIVCTVKPVPLATLIRFPTMFLPIGWADEVNFVFVVPSITRSVKLI